MNNGYAILTDRTGNLGTGNYVYGDIDESKNSRILKKPIPLGIGFYLLIN
ncbi:MAG: hypothetical protein ACI4IV_06055 [Acutalibacteraceae bacterium]